MKILPTVITSALIMFIFACEEKPRTQLQPASPKVTPKSAPSVKVATPTVAPDDTALTEAKNCFASRALQRGESWVTTTPGWDYVEYNKPTFTLTRIQSPSDSLNGYEYHARVHMSAIAMRVTYILYPQPPFGEWTPGGGIEFDLIRQRGGWRCMAAPYNADHQFYPSFDKLAKPDPNKIPR